MNVDVITPMPLSMLNHFWNREFGDSPPMAHLLRASFPSRWVRFHSLADSQRYPNNDGEWKALLERHNAVLSALADDRCELQLLTTSYSATPTLESPDQAILNVGINALHWRSVSMHEIESDPDPNFWHIFSTSIEWGPNVLDDVLRLVAEDQVRNVMILDPRASWLYHPYDGGADVILASTSDRDRLAEKHKTWLSPRTDGL